MRLYLFTIFQNAFARFENAKTRVRDWFVRYAHTPHAERWLAFFSFIESSVFPIPPDPLLAAMALIRNERWVRYAALTSLASVLGGLAGYFIGAVAFEFIGKYIIGFYGLEEEMALVAGFFQKNAFAAILIAAFTPIPYKVFTIAAGFFSVNLFVFAIASTLGRSARFFVVGYLAKRYGRSWASIMFKYFDVTSFILAVIVLVALFFIFNSYF